jgi:hypothetical protein
MFQSWCASASPAAETCSVKTTQPSLSHPLGVTKLVSTRTVLVHLSANPQTSTSCVVTLGLAVKGAPRLRKCIHSRTATLRLMRSYHVVAIACLQATSPCVTYNRSLRSCIAGSAILSHDQPRGVLFVYSRRRSPRAGLNKSELAADSSGRRKSTPVFNCVE